MIKKLKSLFGTKQAYVCNASYSHLRHVLETKLNLRFHCSLNTTWYEDGRLKIRVEPRAPYFVMGHQKAFDRNMVLYRHVCKELGIDMRMRPPPPPPPPRRP